MGRLWLPRLNRVVAGVDIARRWAAVRGLVLRDLRNSRLVRVRGPQAARVLLRAEGEDHDEHGKGNPVVQDGVGDIEPDRDLGVLECVEGIE